MNGVRAPRPLGINTYGFIWTTPAADCLRQLGALGYAEFELVLNPPHLSFEAGRDERAQLRALREQGLRVRGLNLPSLDTNLASPLARMRAYSVGLFRDAIDLAADLGAEYLVTVPGRMNPLLAPAPAQRRQWLHESLRELIPHAQARGVRLALENVPFAALPDAAALGAFVRELATPAVSICYDAANAHFIGESPAEGLRQLAALVEVVHLSDTTRQAWRHDEVGQGDVPFGATLAALDEIAFDGICMMEIIHPQPEAGIVRSHERLARLGWAPRKAESPA